MMSQSKLVKVPLRYQIGPTRETHNGEKFLACIGALSVLFVGLASSPPASAQGAQPVKFEQIALDAKTKRMVDMAGKVVGQIPPPTGPILSTVVGILFTTQDTLTPKLNELREELKSFTLEGIDTSERKVLNNKAKGYVDLIESIKLASAGNDDVNVLFHWKSLNSRLISEVRGFKSDGVYPPYPASNINVEPAFNRIPMYAAVASLHLNVLKQLIELSERANNLREAETFGLEYNTRLQAYTMDFTTDRDKACLERTFFRVQFVPGRNDTGTRSYKIEDHWWPPGHPRRNVGNYEYPENDREKNGLAEALAHQQHEDHVRRNWAICREELNKLWKAPPDPVTGQAREWQFSQKTLAKARSTWGPNETPSIVISPPQLASKLFQAILDGKTFPYGLR